MWKLKRDPQAPTEPTFQHPRRCMNCGHLDKPDTKRGIDENHDSEVGCLVTGGTKYIEHDSGTGLRACSCLKFVPVSIEEIINA